LSLKLVLRTLEFDFPDELYTPTCLQFGSRLSGSGLMLPLDYIRSIHKIRAQIIGSASPVEVPFILQKGFVRTYIAMIRDS
jgi:hypothetical protein